MFDAVFDGLEVAPWFAGIALAVLVGWGAFRLFLTSYRYIRATEIERQRMRQSWRISLGWRRLAPNLGLARVDEITKTGTDGRTVKNKKIFVPKLKVIPEPWGVRAIVKTIPRVGQAEFEKAAGWLADAWECESIEVTRLKAGVLELRGVVGDPLAEHRPYERPASSDWRLPIGHNPWGRPIGVPLRELSGVKVAGMPGFGKTMLQLGWFAALADRPEVQFAIFDGKTADPRYGDWAEVADRAMFIVGDNPEAAHQRLTELVRLLKDRPARLVAERGTHKFWKHGPTVENPLIVVEMDECHNYIDSSGLKGKEKELIEANQRLVRTLTKEGRGLGLLPIVSTQKQTSDAIPTAVRDNLEVGICFATFTLDGAEAALGSGIRKDEANQPVLLVDKDRFVGVCIVTGVPGLSGRYDRVRVGDVDDGLVAELVRRSVDLRRNVIPAPAPVIRDVSAPAAEETAGASIPLQKPTTRRRKTA